MSACSMVAPALAPASAVTAGAAVITAVSVAASPAPAKASPTGPVLVLLQNGQTSTPEGTLLGNAGYTVQYATPSQWQGDSTSFFGGFAALVIGDPSSGSCSALTPTLSGSGNDVIGTNWQAAVTGNIAVLGTAPVLPGTSAANSLITGAAEYAAAGYSSQNQTGTGLYVSLNCDYSTAQKDSQVAFLNGVENLGTGTGKAGALTVQGNLACTNAGAVNTWEAESSATLSGLTSSMLSGTTSWPSPSCPVQEAFDFWPANFTPVGYDSASGVTQNFTASDGQSGQPYLLLGSPPLTTATQAGETTLALASSAGGQVPLMSTVGGANPGAPGAAQPTAGDGVNTENGDFTEADADFAIPTFGPSLDFARVYDSAAAQQQTKTGTPGPMGYGWTDNWATSLSSGKPVPGYMYAISGLGTDNGNGGPPTGIPLSGPGPVLWHNDTYFADTGNNRILEVPGTSGSQWGMQMTGGMVYQIAGSPIGDPGLSKDGTAMTKSLLDTPTGITVDAAGDLYISDSGNNRVIEIPVSSGTQWNNISMTANHIYNVAGHGTGAAGHGGNGGVATNAFLSFPDGLAFDPSGDLYIADSGNNRIQEVFTTGGQQWSQTMLANDIYTVAGSSTGASGDTASNGTPAINAVFNSTDSVSFSSVGDMFFSDSLNNRVIEVPKLGKTEWNISMSANDMYTVAGSATGVAGSSGDGSSAVSAKLNDPEQVEMDNGQNLYIADAGNNRIREVAQTGHTEWNVPMTANDIYTIAGTGAAGFSGDNGPALSAKLNDPEGFALHGTSDLYISDTGNNRMRAVSGSSFDITEFAGNGGSLLSVGDNGPALDSAYFGPAAVATDASGNIYIADEYNNRVQEIAVSNHTQFKIAMTAGDVYTVAGNANGAAGSSGDGSLATSAKLNSPLAVTVDGSGNLYIADSGNNRIQEVSAATADISTVAGSATGASGVSGDGGSAILALMDDPNGVAVDGSGNIYIADFFNNRVQEVPSSGGTQWGQPMTAGDMYTVAGDPTGNSTGTSGDGGAVKNALLNSPAAVVTDPVGDVFIADSANNRIQEMFASGGQTFGQHMTAGDMYTVAGSAAGASGLSGDGGPATSALLNNPVGVTVSSAGDLYIADAFNNRIQEVPVGPGVQWGQQMTAAGMYTVAGNAAGNAGDTGLGGPATGALMNGPESMAIDPAGNMYIPDSTNNLIDEIVSAVSSATFALSPAPGTGTPAGVTITQPSGAQDTFYTVGSGCFGAYALMPSGQYCALPQDVGANLSFSGGNYTYSSRPGLSVTYNSAGQLKAESQTDANGNAIATLSVSYGSPLPGSGNCPSSASSCETVTAANGRSLIIGYNSANLVTSVTDPMGREWTYGYTGSDLTSATDPLGTNVTTYAYGAGSTGNPANANNLLTVTAPNGQLNGPDAGAQSVNVYDASGRVIQQTDPMGYVTTFNYCVKAGSGDCMNSSTGNGLVTVTSADGTSSIFDYVQGTAVATTTPNGSAMSESDSGPDLTGGTLLTNWTSDPGGIRRAFTFDNAGRLLSYTDPLGNVTTSQPADALGDVSCGADAMAAAPCSSSPPGHAPNPPGGASGPAPVAPGNAISPPSAAPPSGVTYTQLDTKGRALYTTTGVYPPGSGTATGTLTAYTLYQGNSVVVNGSNITCSNSPPAAALPCATVDPAGAVAQYTYYTSSDGSNYPGDLKSASAPDGNSGGEVATTTYAYDADGEEVSSISPDGNVPGANAANYTTVTAYNADGEDTSDTSAGGQGATVTPRVMSYTYDPDGNQIKVTNPRGFATTTTYNADDQPAMVTDPDGNSGLTCYDAQGNVAQTVPPAGVASNNLTAASCPTNYPAAYSTRLATDATSSVYDALGEQTSVTTPAPAGQSAPQTTTTTYTTAGLPATVTYPPASNAQGAPNGVVAYTYDTDGNLLTVTNGTGTAASTTSYSYDANGNQAAVTNPDGNKTTYSYDSAGHLVSTTTPKTSAAPNGATTTLAYNTAGQLASSTDPNGVTASFTYSPLGLTTGVSYSGSSAHTVSYGYDAEGNITSTSDATGTSSYVYDPFGELTSYTNGAGNTAGYGYDSTGNTTSITYPLPASATWATTKTVTYGYDHADLLTSVTDFTGNKITVGYNSGALPSSQALGSTGDTVTTSYDDTGAPSAIALKNSAATLLGFNYADAPSGNILSETDTPSSSQTPATYSYDQLGRVTSYTPGTGASHNYGYDAAYNMTALPVGASGTYDQAGELTSSSLSGATTNYSYNADGQRLTAIQGSTTTASGTWNGAQQLTGYSDPAAIMTGAAYDGSGLRESATFGGASQNFTWDPASSALLMDSGNAYIYGTSTTPAEQVNLSTGAVTYPVADSLGSVRGIVSSSGNLTASTSYDAWGNPLTPGGLESYTPFGYAGAYTDPTGLMYLINRYYDPATGQFLSVDPGLSQTGQPYAYADGNPVGLTDPTGMSWVMQFPTGQIFDSQADFQKFVKKLIGGQPWYHVKWEDGTPDWVTDYSNRVINLYTGSRFYGAVNEIHTGFVNDTKFIQTEIARDHYLVRMGRMNVSTASHDGQLVFPANGNWWFSAKGETDCQTEDSAWADCFSSRLAKDILGHKLHIIVYENVNFDGPHGEAETAAAAAFWKNVKVKAQVRKAALKISCPKNQVIKIDTMWKDEFGQLEPNPTPAYSCG